MGSRTDNPVRKPLNLGRICRYFGTDSLRTRKPTRQCKQSYRLWRLHCSKRNYKKAGWSQVSYSRYYPNGFIHWNMDFQSKENESFGDLDDGLYRWLLCYPYEAPYKTQAFPPQVPLPAVPHGDMSSTSAGRTFRPPVRCRNDVYEPVDEVRNFIPATVPIKYLS